MGLKEKLLSASLAGMTAGSALLGGEPNIEESAPPEKITMTINKKQAPQVNQQKSDMNEEIGSTTPLSSEEMQEHFQLECQARDQKKANYTTKEGYKYYIDYSYGASFNFELYRAYKEKKSSFVFDGVTYQTETAYAENQQLKAARKNEKATYTFMDEEKKACSYYPLQEQMNVFGNTYEEVLAPQDEESKKYLNEYAQLYTSKPSEELEMKDRLYQLWRVCGYPEIRNQTEENMTLMGRIIEYNRHGKTAHFKPSLYGKDTVYLIPEHFLGHETFNAEANVDYLLPEIAHAFRHKNNVFGEATQFIGDGLKDILTFKSIGFTPKAQLNNYSNPDRMEYDAHKIVEPALRDFVHGKIKTLEEMYYIIDTERKKNGNEYIWTPTAKEKIAIGAKQMSNSPKELKVADTLHTKNSRSI